MLDSSNVSGVAASETEMAQVDVLSIVDNWRGIKIRRIEMNEFISNVNG